jgi:hypothetical protein
MITYHVTGVNLGNLPIQPSDNSEQQPFTIPHLPLFITVKDRYFIHQFPTWTGVGITALSTLGLIVEIKCTAILEN